MDRKRRLSDSGTYYEDEPQSKRFSDSLDGSAVSMRSNSSLAMKQESTSGDDVNQTQPELNSPKQLELDMSENFSIKDQVEKSFLEEDAFNEDTITQMSTLKFDTYARNEQLELENSNLKKKVNSSSSEIHFLQKVNFLLMEMKELKNENEDLKLNISQINSRHQNEIEQLKILHQNQLSKITVLIVLYDDYL